MESLMVDLAAQSLAGEFKQLGTPEGVAAVRKQMLDMKPGKHKSIKDWMRAAAGGAFGNVKKTDIQREMADKSKAKNNGQPTSPSQAVSRGPEATTMTRERYDERVFLMRENGEEPSKIEAFKKKWWPVVQRGKRPLTA
jgi:hypothetical protein